jgi:hypothetical protein
VNESSDGAIGPRPFRFTPRPGPSIEGPAFTIYFKALVTAVVFGTAAWTLWLWVDGKIVGGTASIMTLFLAAVVMMAYTWWAMMRSVTTLDGESMQQTWIWHKKMELRDLGSAKLIRVPGLDWLIAPRIYLRPLMGKFALFYVASPEMIAECERLVRELRAFRAGSGVGAPGS